MAPICKFIMAPICKFIMDEKEGPKQYADGPNIQIGEERKDTPTQPPVYKDGKEYEMSHLPASFVPQPFPRSQ
ncbi:unnamed protein product [Caenorhabditis nigoni]